MAVERKMERIGSSRHAACSGADDIRAQLLQAVGRSSSQEALFRLVEIAARCVCESVAWDAFADAQDVGSSASCAEVQRLEREAQAAKQARIRIVDRLREDIGG